VLQARGQRGLREDDGIAGSRMAWGRRRRGLGDGTWSIMLRAQERGGVDNVVGFERTMVLWAQERCSVDDVAGLGTAPAWSMASTSWVGEGGGAYGGGGARPGSGMMAHRL
jgi:hypothetical protein